MTITLKFHFTPCENVLRRSRRRAFTIVELLTVIALMALIIAGGVAVFGQARENTMRQQAKMKLASLAAQIDATKVSLGAYPPDLTTLQTTLEITDPWGNPVVYQLAPGSIKFTLTSKGADQILNTTDDIVYDSTKD